MADHFRTVIREEAFEDEVGVYIRDMELVDDFLMAAEILLARDPEIGTRTPESDVWLLPMSPVAGFSFYLYYTFDAECV